MFLTRIHVNLLGNWVELAESDTIFNTNAYVWIKENNLHEHTFIWVGYQGKGYKIHVSQVQLSQV